MRCLGKGGIGGGGIAAARTDPEGTPCADLGEKKLASTITGIRKRLTAAFLGVKNRAPKAEVIATSSVMLGSKIETRMISRKNCGMLLSTSTTRWPTKSTRPPKKPIERPAVTPIR